MRTLDEERLKLEEVLEKEREERERLESLELQKNLEKNVHSAFTSQYGDKSTISIGLEDR